MISADSKTEVVDKIEEIRRKLEKIREEKEQLSPKHSQRKSITNSINTTENKKSIKKMCHPNLGCVMYELAHSPYMTRPTSAYSQPTITLQEDLKYIKYKDQKQPPSEPKITEDDLRLAKKTYLNEILHFKPPEYYIVSTIQFV